MADMVVVTPRGAPRKRKTDIQQIGSKNTHTHTIDTRQAWRTVGARCEFSWMQTRYADCAAKDRGQRTAHTHTHTHERAHTRAPTVTHMRPDRHGNMCVHVQPFATSRTSVQSVERQTKTDPPTDTATDIPRRTDSEDKCCTSHDHDFDPRHTRSRTPSVRDWGFCEL